MQSKKNVRVAFIMKLIYFASFSFTLTASQLSTISQEDCGILGTNGPRSLHLVQAKLTRQSMLSAIFEDEAGDVQKRVAGSNELYSSCRPGQIQRSARKLFQTRDNSESACQAKCAITDGCVAFDYTTNSKRDACRGVGSGQTPRDDPGNDDRTYCELVVRSVDEVGDDTPSPPPTTQATQGPCIILGPSYSLKNSGGKANGAAWPHNNVATPEACGELCANNPDCSVFHYYGSASHAYGDCYLHKSGTMVGVSDGQDRYVATCKTCATDAHCSNGMCINGYCQAPPISFRVSHFPCPTGTTAIANEAECKSSASVVGKPWGRSGNFCGASPGCSIAGCTGKVYWNRKAGSGWGTTICKNVDTRPSPAPIGAPYSSCRPGQVQSGAPQLFSTDDSAESACLAKCAITNGCVAFDYTTKSASNACRGVGIGQTPRDDPGSDNRSYCEFVRSETAPSAASTTITTSAPGSAEGSVPVISDILASKVEQICPAILFTSKILCDDGTTIVEEGECCPVTNDCPQDCLGKTYTADAHNSSRMCFCEYCSGSREYKLDLSDEESFLKAHNYFRCLHGHAMLGWDDAVAKNAETAARQSCETGTLTQKLLPGENLMKGQTSPEEVVTAWYNELIDPGYAVGDWGPNTTATGHYTAVMWNASKKIGCGSCGSGQNKIWACHYALEESNFGDQSAWEQNIPQTRVLSATPETCCAQIYEERTPVNMFVQINGFSG